MKFKFTDEELICGDNKMSFFEDNDFTALYVKGEGRKFTAPGILTNSDGELEEATVDIFIAPDEDIEVDETWTAGEIYNFPEKTIDLDCIPVKGILIVYIVDNKGNMTSYHFRESSNGWTNAKAVEYYGEEPVLNPEYLKCEIVYGKPMLSYIVSPWEYGDRAEAAPIPGEFPGGEFVTFDFQQALRVSAERRGE